VSDTDWKPGWFIGGDVVLDFVNTVSWRLDPERAADRLPDALAVTGWAAAVGLIDAAHLHQLREQAVAAPSVADRSAVEVRMLREALYRPLQQIAVGETPNDTEVGALRGTLTDALNHAEITSVVPLRWTAPLSGLGDLPRLLGLAAWRLLQFEDLTRLRQCQDAGCGWLFLDRSKNASRTWCSGADCGNRTRVRRHHQRRRTPPPNHIESREKSGET
jgi:predicted RNA-binding Zn ribbon-like protein